MFAATFARFRKVAIPLFERNETIFKILLKDIAMKTLDCQLKLMALVWYTLQFVREGILLFTEAEQQVSTCRFVQSLEL